MGIHSDKYHRDRDLARPDMSYLRVYVLHLRRKIEDDPSNPHLLITEPGVGYRLMDEA